MELKIEYLPVGELSPYDKNARKHGTDDVDAIAASIREFGFSDPIGIWRGNVIVEGHGRLLAAKKLGMERVPVIRLDHLTDEQRRAYALAHNKTAELSEWDANLVDLELAEISDIDMAEFGFEIPSDESLVDSTEPEVEHKSLVDRFIIPPFSVFDTRQGYWKDRTKMWERTIGIRSTEGRGGNLIGAPDNPDYVESGFTGAAPQTSEFDPTLAEICYKFFCPSGGHIIDPFAGGSARGIVADKLGYRYMGFDIREEQIAANQTQCSELGVSPEYICDDSNNVDDHLPNECADLVFTCPPYFDLEVYSDCEQDLSNMTWEEFGVAYRSILSRFERKLKNNRFFVVVIGDVRDRRGFYRNLIDCTKRILLDCGLNTYNEAILLEQPGTAAIRATRTFSGGRKLIKTHQNVLIFFKGDPRTIKGNYCEVQVDEAFLSEAGC